MDGREKPRVESYSSGPGGKSLPCGTGPLRAGTYHKNHHRCFGSTRLKFPLLRRFGPWVPYADLCWIDVRKDTGGMTVEKVTAYANDGPMSPGTLPNSTSSPG